MCEVASQWMMVVVTHLLAATEIWVPPERGESVVLENCGAKHLVAQLRNREAEFSGA